MTEVSPRVPRLSRRTKIALAVGVLVVVAIGAVASIIAVVTQRPSQKHAVSYAGFGRMTRIVMLAAIAAMTAATVSVPANAHADPAPPCSNGQVVVTAGAPESGMGHRGVTLIFSLVPGAEPCTLTGYPGVDSGTGGPLQHAKRTLSGYLGGVRTDTPPTITVTPWQPAHAVVEGDTANPDGDYKCPSYSDLRVTPPDTTDAVTVPAGIDGACHFQVHPVGSDW
jgi:Protein of unknown function (DUF4232)